MIETLSYFVKEYLENHAELIETPNILLEEIQEDFAPADLGQFTKILYSCGIEFDLDKIYPQYDDIRFFDLENPDKILPIITYLRQAYTVIDLKEPINPTTFQKIADHAMVDNLFFLRKNLSSDIYQIKAGLHVDRDVQSAYHGYIFGRIDFYDRLGVKITDAFLDMSRYEQYLFGVDIPDLGYAVNLNKAIIQLNKSINNIQYLAKYLKE